MSEQETSRQQTRARARRPRRWSVIRVGAGVLALMAGLAPGADAQAAGAPQAPAGSAVAPPAAPRGHPAPGREAVSEADREAGRLALQAAARARTAAYALEGEARTQALLDAARQFGGVADGAQFGLDERAEAAFRAGELLRARGRAEEALSRFGQAVSLGESAAPEREARGFAARGLLEQAHALRRADDHEAALELYGQLGARFPEQERSLAHARDWTVKLLVRAARLDDARPWVDGYLGAHPSRPADALEAAELLAGALVEAGRAEEARGLVERLEAALPAAGHDPTVTDELGSALQALRVTVSASGY